MLLQMIETSLQVVHSSCLQINWSFVLRYMVTRPGCSPSRGIELEEIKDFFSLFWLYHTVQLVMFGNYHV